MSSEIEKESLATHVELCALRYQNLEHKLNALEEKVEKLEEHIVFIRDNIASVPQKATKHWLL